MTKTIQQSRSFVILTLFSLFFIFTNFTKTSAAFLNQTIRVTSRSDIIGRYTLHPDSIFAANPNLCPPSITTFTFEFAVTDAPKLLASPEKFNIQIPHTVTAVDGNDCESSGSIIAVTWNHPFVRGIQRKVLDAWASGGQRGSSRSVWIPETFIEAAERLPWAIGYDFSERSCNGVTIRPGAAFMWFQPQWGLKLGSLQITGRNKYLLVTFKQTPLFGCVYVAEKVGGQDDFPRGPVSDPSVAVANQQEKDENESEETSESVVVNDDDDDDDDDDEDEDSDIPSPISGPVQDESVDTNPDDDESSNSPDSNLGPEEEDSDPDTIFGSSAKGNSSSDSAETDKGGIFEPNGEEESSDNAACFPASAMITLNDGKQISMKELKIGHQVKVKRNEHSTVYFFSHRSWKQEKLYQFVKLYTESGHHITVSPSHYIHCNFDVLCSAASIQVGHVIVQGNGMLTKVIKVENVLETGLFAPHTLHGDIIVNNIKASTYTMTVHPHLAHYVLLMPIRLLYHFNMGFLTQGILDNGANLLARFIPKGPQTITNII